jgi:hypothetical protein
MVQMRLPCSSSAPPQLQTARLLPGPRLPRHQIATIPYLISIVIGCRSLYLAMISRGGSPVGGRSAFAFRPPLSSISPCCVAHLVRRLAQSMTQCSSEAAKCYPLRAICLAAVQRRARAPLTPPFCRRYAACVAALLPDVRHSQCSQQFAELKKCVRLSMRKR